MIDGMLFGKHSCNIEKRSYSLNTLAGIINALRPVIMQMIVTRITGITDAGIMTIAFAINNLFVTVGKFGVRNYQATDLNSMFSFKTYFKARIVSVVAMLFLGVSYFIYGLFMRGNSLYKAATIFLFCLIFAVDAVEDVFWGDYQLKGRLDVGAVIYIIRWLITIVIFGVILAIGHSLYWASLGALFITFFAFAYLITKSYKKFLKDTDFIYVGKWTSVLKRCLPLFVGAFLMIYITNSPKYSIERYLSDDIQACFGFVSMPVFVIELLNNFLYQPKLVEIAMAWEKGELKTFRKYIFRQSTMLLILTGICELGAYFLGIPVLSAVYAVDLTSYKWILLLLLLGGGGLAFVGFFAVLLTVMRKQHWMMICYIIVAAAALFLMPYSVSNSGVWGGTIVFLMLMFSLAFLLFLAVGLNYKCRIWGERKK